MPKRKPYTVGLFQLVGPSDHAFALLNDNDLGDYHSYAREAAQQATTAEPVAEPVTERPTLDLTGYDADTESNPDASPASTASSHYELDHYEFYDDEFGEHTTVIYRNRRGDTLALREQDTPPAAEFETYSPGGFK